MKLPTEIYKYVEYELYHYDIYKEELASLRVQLLEEGYALSYGQRVTGGKTSNPTEKKAMALVSSAAVLSLEKTIRAIEAAQETAEHKAVFQAYYQKKRRDLYCIYDDLGMTRSTFYRYRQDLIMNTARELGLLKPGFSWLA